MAGFPSFSWLNNICVCVCVIFFINASVELICLSSFCFCMLAIVNNAAVNMGGKILLQDPVFLSFGHQHRHEIAGSYDSSVFRFWETSVLFSTVVTPVYILTNSVGGFLFFHVLTSTYLLSGLFDSNRWHFMWFDLHFPNGILSSLIWNSSSDFLCYLDLEIIEEYMPVIL